MKSLTAQAAIERAYTSYIAPEAFPTCVMFIEMSPTMVDVNVHPAKLEVKFVDERSVFEIVYYTVKSALEKHEYRPEMEFAKRNEKNLEGAFVAIGQDTKGEQIRMSMPAYIKPTVAPQNDSYSKVDTPPVSRDFYKERENARSIDYDKPIRVAASHEYINREVIDKPTLAPKDSVELLKLYSEAKITESVYAPSVTSETLVQEVPINVEDTPEYKLIGEAFDCYVMVEYNGELLIIDKHAAHERIIFEDLKKQRESDTRVATQLLMLPLTVILDKDEIATAFEYSEDISAVGFEYSINGDGVDIVAIPEAVSIDDAETLFIQMVDEIIEGKGKPSVTDSVRKEKALYQIACKAAIKGGRKYTIEIIHWLIKKVLMLPDITVCPHGRPIAFKLTKSELDRQFERLK